MALRSLALCAGVGGLDLGVELAAEGHQLVCAVERQAYYDKGLTISVPLSPPAAITQA